MFITIDVCMYACINLLFNKIQIFIRSLKNPVYVIVIGVIVVVASLIQLSLY